MTISKQFRITLKQFILFAILSQGFMLLGIFFSHDFEPSKKICVLMIAISVPMLLIGLRWMRQLRPITQA